MGLSRKGGNRPKPAMNVTPLVDVVLVLLIIFMVVLPAMEEGVTIDIPSIDHSDETTSEDAQAEPFMISVARSGMYFFDNTPVPPAEFEEFLAERHRRQPQRRVVLRLDGQAPYLHVRELMATCRQIGFPGVSLRVNQRNDDDGAATASASHSNPGALAQR